MSSSPGSGTFAVGDRVIVSDRNSPWFPSRGVITGPGRGMESGPYQVWMVKLDGYTEVAHYARELDHEETESA